jgi:flagellar basal-body rod protein FlgB
MRFDLDSALGIHQQALLLRARRAQLLAENLANADTPGYKAKDIDFKSVLDSAHAAAQGVQMNVTQPGHIADEQADLFGSETKYRIPFQPSIDGNTVDTQIEKSQFVRNAIEYQASLKFLDGRIKSLLTAIRGE